MVTIATSPAFDPREMTDEDRLVAALCKLSFEDFCREFWEEVPGAGVVTWSWHMSFMCQELQGVAERVFKGERKEYDVALNISPGTSKSTICSILFPAWVWTRMAHARVLTASHTDELVLDLANKSRQVIKGEKYQRCFPHVTIRDDQDTKGYYANTRGGDRKTCTVAGKSPTGFHAHFIIIDDPIDPKKVLSEAETKTAKTFITDVLPSRKTNKAVTVTFLVMQRLGVNDPTDVMLKEAEKEGAAPVRHICLPAELPKGEDGTYLEANVSPRELAARYVDGLMDPSRLDREVLKEFHARGALYYSTQFLQRPYVRGGGMFKEQYFSKRVKAAPLHCKRIRYWDRAATDGGGCRTAGVLLAFDGENWFIEHVVMGQWEPAERNQRMRACALRDRARYGPKNEPSIWVEAEGGSSGRDAWKGVARALAGFPIREHKISGLGNKEVRAEPWSCQLAAGNVYLVDNGESTRTGKSEWDINAYVEEHCAFPLGEFKDQVDASSGAFSLLVGTPRGPALRSINISDKKKNVARFIVCSRTSLSNLTFANPALLVTITDPDPVQSEPFLHGLDNLVEQVNLSFTDLDPNDLQDVWDDPVAPYDKTPADLVMNRDHGKTLWRFLLKKRNPNPEVIVLVDEEGTRATSLAYAIADTLHQPRSSIYSPDRPDNKEEGNPPVAHVYDMTRTARGSVV